MRGLEVGRREGNPQSVRDASGVSAAGFGRSLAVVIGIDVYGEGIAPLHSAVADAKAVAAALQRDHGFETWCLFDDDARLPHLQTLLGTELPAALGPDDRLLFYFAGHGIAYNGDLGPAGYLVPAHARSSDPSGFLPMQAVHDELAKPFALALLDGLRGAADCWQDGVITADQLAMYVRERVASATEAMGRCQMPGLFPLFKHDGGQFVFQVPGRPLALAPAPPLGDDTDPYRDLCSFQAQDHHLFFGRDTVTKQLVNAVLSRQLTVVSGPSACGKSSLVRAGLVPALRARGWTILPARPAGHEPLAVLDAWARELGGAPAAHDPSAAWAAAVSALAAAGPSQPYLLVVDQLEELIDRRTAARDRRAFLEALAFALETAPALHLVVVVRSDAELRLRESALAPWWTTARFAVPPMTRDELRQVIKTPAAAAVLHFEPSSLVERLIDDVVQSPAPLPLLSSTLSELYRRCSVATVLAWPP